jgi:hypothetical protein
MMEEPVYFRELPPEQRNEVYRLMKEARVLLDKIGYDLTKRRYDLFQQHVEELHEKLLEIGGILADYLGAEK